jgi:hypothetical protein
VLLVAALVAVALQGPGWWVVIVLLPAANTAFWAFAESYHHAYKRLEPIPGVTPRWMNNRPFFAYLRALYCFRPDSHRVLWPIMIVSRHSFPWASFSFPHFCNHNHLRHGAGRLPGRRRHDLAIARGPGG